ncbi:TlpA disulfide reductase family protein [Noviherbaspirillum sp.]|jgi:thiol-disulfide isomerase/thioredoxin|uniref:TlpA disulfide reductase family protein n=1 Tax=Noviherbaspirillum sp. TaxID=1926288 RepID=UPI002DDCDF22|nr:TlpA disulfide reductase family protein [Noviherbaspirillum sp.]
MRKNLVPIFVVGVLFAALGVYFGYRNLEPDSPQSNAVTSLFNLSMPTVDGNAEPLSKWKNKTLLVNFWATWCAPCVDEMPELSALQATKSGTNLQIIGIGIDSASNIAQFAKKHQINYPLYTAGVTGTELSRQFGNQAGGLPYTVLIDGNGKVRKTYLGRLNIKEVEADLKLE